MQLFTHQIHVNQIQESPIKAHIQKRFDSLTFETDVPPNIIVVESGDDISGSNYAFIGNNGLLSDLFEEFSPGETGFVRPYEWISYLPSFRLYGTLLLSAVNSRKSYFVYFVRKGMARP